MANLLLRVLRCFRYLSCCGASRWMLLRSYENAVPVDMLACYPPRGGKGVHLQTMLCDALSLNSPDGLFVIRCTSSHPWESTTVIDGCNTALAVSFPWW